MRLFQCFAIVAAATGTLIGAAGGPAADASVTITQVSLAPTTLEAGLSYTATLVVRSSGYISVQKITVAVRDGAGDNLDFPGAHSATIDGTYVYQSGARSFAAGSYTIFGSYEVNNAWIRLPSQTLTVAATTVMPQPVGMSGAFSLILNAGPADLAQWGGWFGTGIAGPVNLPDGNDGDDEDACYNPANVTVSGSFLDMALTDEPSACRIQAAYTGSLLSSNGMFNQPFGAFEAEIYLPATTTGTIADWPAFWMDGTGPWPKTGELDIMEGLSGHACYHFHYQDSSGANHAPGACTSTGPGWHTFGALWQDGSVAYYYDGAEISTITQGITTYPMYLILDFTHSTSSPTVIPATMQVAYVRAWIAGVIGH